MRSPAQFLLLLLLAVIGVKMSEQLYRYVAFRDERAQVAVLQERLLDAGAALEVARGEQRAARGRLEREDAGLQAERAQLMRLQRALENGPVGEAAYERYLAALERYNVHVVERNHRSQELEAIRTRMHAAGEAYLALADSVTALAARMGESYYSVPTPLEAAAKRGVLRTDP